MPAFTTTLGQLSISVADLVLACAALYVLLPPDAGVSFVAFTGLYMVAMVAGAISTVPGGLGVFESILLLLLPGVPAQDLLGALLAYRVIYYVAAVCRRDRLLTGYEIWQQRARMRLALSLDAPLARFRGPAGDVGARLRGRGHPADVRRHAGGGGAHRGAARQFLPLSVLELSHLAGSAIGVALLVLARGLYYRLDAAWHLMVWLLGAGIAASLLKGLDYEEALILCLVLLPLLATRREFYRRASLLAEPLAPRWLAAVAMAIGASIWIGLLAHREVPYQSELWWQFAFDASAPRMLRASLVAVLGLGVAAAYRLLQPPRPRAASPTPADLERAAAHRDSERIRQRQSRPARRQEPAVQRVRGELRHVRRSGDAAGSRWVTRSAQPPSAARWSGVSAKLCDREGGACVFYEVDAENLPLYVDAGLSLSEARRGSPRGAAGVLAGRPGARAAASLRTAGRSVTAQPSAS